MTPENKAKLPKWAQAEVTVLERRVETMAGELAEYAGEGSVLSRQVQLDWIPVPGKAIRFQPKGHQEIMVSIKPNGRLYINAPNGQVAIRPVAGNCFEVSVERLGA